MRRGVKNFLDGRSVLLALRGALRFSPWMTPIFFMPVLGSPYFRGGLPEGLKLMRSFGMFVAREMSCSLCGIASGLIFGSPVQALVATEFATNQAMMFVLRVAGLCRRKGCKERSDIGKGR
jgi:hypothetical protein